MINATNQSKPKELIPSGNYVARCFSMIHIGTVTEEIKGEPKRLNKVRIAWELPTELRIVEGKDEKYPMVISKEYTLSMHIKSNLRHDLESWRGQSYTEKQAECFDISKLLGVPCMLNIIHRMSNNGEQYATISNISSLPKGMAVPDPIQKPFEWNYEEKFDEFALSNFPKYIQDKIKLSEEYRKLTNPIIDLSVSDEVHEDEVTDLPF
jgi:hypothetical protein